MSQLAINVLLSSVGFLTGSVFLKRYAEAGTWADLGCAFAIFAVSNLIYAQVLSKGLGQGAALSSMAHLIMMSVVGILVFGEKMGPLHVTGLISALTTIWIFTVANHTG